MDINYYSLHYHMKKCGVRIVIENIFDCLRLYSESNLNLFYSSKYQSFSKRDVKTIDLEGIDYLEQIFKNKEELWDKAFKLKERIRKKLDLSKPCVLHCHNVNLFKNSILGAALLLLANDLETEEFVMLMHVHDFAEDSRADRLHLMMNCSGKEDRMFGTELAYPINRNIVYLTLNSRDSKLLEKLGIFKNRIFLYPNSINIDFFSSKPLKKNNLKDLIAKFAKKNGYTFDKKRKIILSPLKPIRRKNIIESLLILNLLNSIKDEWQFLITLDADSKADVAYVNRIKEYVKKKKLPVVIGFGYDLISSSEERKYKNGKVVQYNMVDLFSIAETIMTTSILEGFGFTYTEGWLAEKKVVGRRIDFIFKDLEANGIKLNHFYNKIIVDGKDFKEYDHNMQLKLLKMIDYKKLLKQKEVKRLVDFMKDSKKTVLNNKKKIAENYSLMAYYHKLKKIIMKAMELRKDRKKKYKLDNKKLIDYFER